MRISDTPETRKISKKCDVSFNELNLSKEEQLPNHRISFQKIRIDDRVVQSNRKYSEFLRGHKPKQANQFRSGLFSNKKPIERKSICISEWKVN